MDKDRYIQILAQELNLGKRQIQATAELLAAGATVPFMARYRKEATENLDEVAIAAIRDRLLQLSELDKRKEAVLRSLKEQNKLTDDLEKKVSAAASLAILEDIYLPYKPKKRTRAMMAKEKGLEPLARCLLAQKDSTIPDQEAAQYVHPKKEIHSTDEALKGARDIIAEWVNEDAQARAGIRDLFFSKAILRAKVIPGKEEEGVKFQDYFYYQESISKIPSHRLLAIRRGEKEKILLLRILPSEEQALEFLGNLFIKADNDSAQQVQDALRDGYKRLLSLSIETEVRLATKVKADEEAIQVFSQNLRQLLMAPPLGSKNVLAIDPGFRTGCKMCALDRQGKLLGIETIYLNEQKQDFTEAKQKILDHMDRFEIEAIAIGNGTASRETERFVRQLELNPKIPIVIVNESGASIYSASEVARQEFPDQDVTIRGAISIGRRLMDPLAEFVKIDPKSIGVGQYQHDVDQNKLKKSLDDVVMSCVNSVGVELNTASQQLLSYVSGLGASLAQTIIDHRNQNGPFRSRDELKQVAGVGAKVFEQAAGFLRIHNADNPLDASAVHPESYGLVDQMARDCGCTVKNLMSNENMRMKINLSAYVTETVGLPTLQDILTELAKPGRDPRKDFQITTFKEGVEKPEDLTPGMKLPGIITNITDFGVFVDIGVHLDGLVHISQLSDRFVKHPLDVVQLQQNVVVRVLEVDLPRQRIALTMKKSDH